MKKKDLIYILSRVRRLGLNSETTEALAQVFFFNVFLLSEGGPHPKKKYDEKNNVEMSSYIFYSFTRSTEPILINFDTEIIRTLETVTL